MPMCLPSPGLWRRLSRTGCLFLGLSALADGSEVFPSLASPIREEIAEVESAITALPVFPLNTSPWTMGYSSEQHTDPELPVVIEVTFPEAETVDLVALMPSSFRDQENRVQSWGFPLRFMVERILPDGRAEVVADYRGHDYPQTGVDPQFFPVPDPVSITGLRITVARPAQNTTWWGASQIVSFSELYAFSGARNVALNAGVSASSSNEFGLMWSTKCLTDGFTLFSPLFHDLESPVNNIIGDGLKTLKLEIDLGRSQRIDEYHLWPVVHAIQHNYPPSSGLGFPLGIRLEASSTPDFADTMVIHEDMNLVYRPGAGPFMRRTRPAHARYLRFLFTHGFPDFVSKPPLQLDRIALSEIEILGRGEIVSRGVSVVADGLAAYDQERVAALTDGRSNEGQILPLRGWLDAFKRRVQLEATLHQLRRNLDIAQRAEERRSRMILIAAIGLILFLIQSIWLVRVVARRRESRMRERIACDLHDEVGANVSSMAHTTELLAESIEKPSPTQTRLLGNLIESARVTCRETKHFIRFIEGENLSLDIADQLMRTADQILGTIPRAFSLENTRSFNTLDPRTKWNLLLFYKESLNNIIKHAEASEVTITAFRQDKRLVMKVADNGCGFSQEQSSCRRLEERAALLRGKLEIDSRPGEGTRITLHFKNRRKP